jgi:hypothetical protein
LDCVFVGIEDEVQGNAAFLVLRLEPGRQHTGTIRVTRQSLKRCSSAYRDGGACLIQITRPSLDEREVRVVFDLADIELAPYEDAPFYPVDFHLGPDGE